VKILLGHTGQQLVKGEMHWGQRGHDYLALKLSRL